MSGSDTLAYKAKMFVQGLPGRKASNGGAIPDDVHERIYAAARGLSQQIWGRDPLPQHIQELHDAGVTDPQGVHDAYGQMPHPHAPGLTVADYPRYAKAYETYRQHR